MKRQIILILSLAIFTFNLNATELSIREQAETMAEYWTASLVCSFKVLPEDGLQKKHLDFFQKTYDFLEAEGAKAQYLEFFEARKSEIQGLSMKPTECVELYYQLGGK